jgi:hypothetical protein
MLIKPSSLPLVETIHRGTATTKDIYISFDNDGMNANVVVDNVVVKEFRNNELSYMNAHRYAMDLSMKEIYQ